MGRFISYNRSSDYFRSNLIHNDLYDREREREGDDPRNLFIKTLDAFIHFCFLIMYMLKLSVRRCLCRFCVRSRQCQGTGAVIT